MFFSPCLLSVKSQDSMASKSVLTMVVLRHLVLCMSCMPLMLMPPDVMSCHPNNLWQVISLCQTVPCHAMSSCQTVPCYHVKPCHVIMMYGHAMPTQFHAMSFQDTMREESVRIHFQDDKLCVVRSLWMRYKCSAEASRALMKMT